ncbi:hypothetical protein [Paludisphaera sp.]|uniref:hypothetical protein n=1 Tax=Paludisphaera sp. TaxID=2017432 RepID=UPI00301CB44A
MDAHRAWWSRRLAAALVLSLASLPCGASAATYRTTNFEVTAPTREVAQQVGDHAEECRRTIARAWLGREMPDWAAPCPIRVKLTGGEAGGATTFGFDRGRVTDQSMMVEGRLDRILASSLPHEVTHTIFAAFFGGPMPRWADEGASLLSEDERELTRHDQIAADLVGRRGEIKLAELFVIDEYPKDLMAFYGQGYSVSRFLIEIGGRPRFLRFVRDGLRSGWDEATFEHYGLTDVHELDRAWRSWHRGVLADRRTPPSHNPVLAFDDAPQPIDSPRRIARP